MARCASAAACPERVLMARQDPQGSPQGDLDSLARLQGLQPPLLVVSVGQTSRADSACDSTGSGSLLGILLKMLSPTSGMLGCQCQGDVLSSHPSQRELWGWVLRSPLGAPFTLLLLNVGPTCGKRLEFLALSLSSVLLLPAQGHRGDVRALRLSCRGASPQRELCTAVVMVGTTAPQGQESRDKGVGKADQTGLVVPRQRSPSFLWDSDGEGLLDVEAERVRESGIELAQGTIPTLLQQSMLIFGTLVPRKQEAAGSVKVVEQLIFEDSCGVLESRPALEEGRGVGGGRGGGRRGGGRGGGEDEGGREGGGGRGGSLLSAVHEGDPPRNSMPSSSERKNKRVSFQDPVSNSTTGLTDPGVAQTEPGKPTPCRLGRQSTNSAIQLNPLVQDLWHGATERQGAGSCEGTGHGGMQCRAGGGEVMEASIFLAKIWEASSTVSGMAKGITGRKLVFLLESLGAASAGAREEPAAAEAEKISRKVCYQRQQQQQQPQQLLERQVSAGSRGCGSCSAENESMPQELPAVQELVVAPLLEEKLSQAEEMAFQRVMAAPGLVSLSLSVFTSCQPNLTPCSFHVTAHWITEDWTHASAPLGFLHVKADGQDSLGIKLATLLSRLDILDCVMAITTDIPCSSLHWQSLKASSVHALLLPCCFSALSEAVQALLQDRHTQRHLSAVRKVVALASSSPLQRASLQSLLSHDRCKQTWLSPQVEEEFLRECPVHWVAVVDAIQFLLGFQDPIKSWLELPETQAVKDATRVQVSKLTWRALDALRALLKPFLYALAALKGEHSPSVGYSLGVFLELKAEVEKALYTLDAEVELSEGLLNSLESLDRYTFELETLVLPLLLDPFSGGPRLKRLFQQRALSLTESVQRHELKDDELLSFCMERNNLVATNAVLWWAEHCDILPSMATAARDCLAVSASTSRVWALNA